MTDLLNLIEEMRREVEAVTGIAKLPRERARSTIEQWQIEQFYKNAAKRK